MYRLYFSDLYNEYILIYKGESKEKALEIIQKYEDRNIRRKLLLIEHKNNADFPYYFDYTSAVKEESNVKVIKKRKDNKIW